MRRFPNFLEAYQSYAEDEFVPDHFNTWCGLSIVAGALERKVWLPWNDTFSYYPNIYVLLAALPGIGKTTALNKAVGIIREMDSRGGNLQFIPSQVTEAEFIELLETQASFQIGSRLVNHASGYYFAAEASNSLKDIFGSFVNALTDFYDCPDFWEKATKKDGRTTLNNVCINLLAASTFDYLGKLVTDDNIMGGFASRLIYVVQHDKLLTRQAFQAGLGNPEAVKQRKEFRSALVHDLGEIHKISGPFEGTREMGLAWEEWRHAYETERQNLESEQMQSLLVRTNTNVIKVAILLSACESDRKVIELEHFNKAVELVTTCAASIPKLLLRSRATDTKSQSGINAAIEMAIAKKGPMTETQLKRALGESGFHPDNIDKTVQFMLKNKRLGIKSLSSFGAILEVLGNPDEQV